MEMPEILRSLVSPEVASQSNPRVPPCINIARLVSGDMTIGAAERSPRAASAYSHCADDLVFVVAADARQDAARARALVALTPAPPKIASYPLEAHDTEALPLKDAIPQVFTALASLSDDLTPLIALQAQVKDFFSCGTYAATNAFARMITAVRDCTCEVARFSFPIPSAAMPWNSCKLAASQVLVLAAPADAVLPALALQSRSLSGGLKLESIRGTPTASLRAAFNEAKALATGPLQSTTIMDVTLIDVRIFELAAQGKSQPFSTFTHSFVIGVGPEGVIIWQSWGEYGYRLDEYLNRDGARVRNWTEAQEFVDDFQRLLKLKVHFLNVQ